jgi:hypothetical protein
MAIGFQFDGQVKSVSFRQGINVGWEYVCGLDDMDYLEFMHIYEDGPNGIRRKRCRAINLDGTESRFFAVAVADCYDPSVTIVRADVEGEAEERFIEESPAEWLTGPALSDYPEDTLSYDGEGHPYDSSSVHVWEVFPVAVEFG